MSNPSRATPRSRCWARPRRSRPSSETAKYTERLRKVAPDRIEGDMTIEDLEALTEPWTVKQIYVRAEGLDHLVLDTFSNDRTVLEDGLLAILPPLDVD